MKDSEIQQMTPESLIKMVYHELNQKSAIVLSLTIALLEARESDAEVYDPAELLLFLKSEVETIRKISDLILTWLNANSTKPRSEPKT